ncbi:PhzF family phenazine biosynthesis protein [Hahella ganghwensis]|uniref:PhzF family phenazine biosynthesis protein n=1 Tax=Hahella ganghwensis TaxID=286420 RepID=UPI0003680C3F|nr:PhzF family phenazine biosynthesis protein [Hahella ganghwensis]
MSGIVRLINSFVENGQGGNPAGVVLDADSLDENAMQAIASQAGLSEVAFVSKSDIATVKLDFFTPNKRIAHCGHATVAAFSVMAQQGLLENGNYTKETVDGIRHIRIEGDEAYLEQKKVSSIELPAEHYSGVSEALGIPFTSFTRSAPPALINNGVGWLVIILETREELAQLTPNHSLIRHLSVELDLIGFYVVCRETQVPGRTLSARMFAPSYGIDEESATGMGAGCAAIYLHDFLQCPDQQVLVEQGHLMHPASPSLLKVELEFNDGDIERLWVGGAAATLEGEQ